LNEERDRYVLALLEYDDLNEVEQDVLEEWHFHYMVCAEADFGGD
jgi:hypothetical protein